MTSLQPVEWPELSTTTNLQAGGFVADSTAGQNAAYHYASYQLITNYYLLGAQGNYLDDIHYYFTSSNNTFLDYHTFDPAKLPYPGGSCYQWTDPAPNSPILSCFTANDFGAVTAQLHSEFVYLTNVLQFMVTGSTNMKDIVASGGGSAALALINAAAEVEGSVLQPAPTTPVTTNVAHILSLTQNVISVAAAIVSGGLTLEGSAAVKAIGPIAGIITGTFGMSSAITGGLNTSGPPPIPSRDSHFLTTIGNLSSSSLQQQFTVGFDTGLDSILGDWQKLSILGPKITDTNTPGFQSPNQVGQLFAVQQIGSGAQRSFYMALLPTQYSVQHYTGWWGEYGVTNYPDMASQLNTTPIRCSGGWYYGNTDTPPSNFQWQAQSYFSYANYMPIFYFYNNTEGFPAPPAPVDWYVIGSQKVLNVSSSKETIAVLDPQLAATLFAPSGLNIPMDPFLDQDGPMANVWWSVPASPFDGFSPANTCSLGALNYKPSGVGAPEPSGGAGSGNSTTTTLAAPSSGVLGDGVALQATVSASGAPVTPGTVDFQDGDTDLGNAALDATGTANLTVTTLGLGAHAITAYFLSSGSYGPSNSAASTVTIYSNDPDMTMSSSSGTITTSYGSSSTPLTIQVASKWGLSGMVNFACSGLPAGATCQFTPSQATLDAGGTANTSLSISATPVRQAGLSWWGLGAVLLPLQLLWLGSIRKAALSMRGLMCIVVLGLSLGAITGCGGSSKPVPSGSTNTILVVATSGTVSRSVPITVTIQ